MDRGLRCNEIQQQRTRAVEFDEIPKVDIDVDWSIRLNREYGNGYSIYMKMLMDQLMRFIYFAIQLRVNGKINCVWIQVPRVDSGKTTIIETLCKRYVGYCLQRGDGAFLGAKQKDSPNFYYLDSAVPDNFGKPPGITYTQWEGFSGGRKVPLPVKGESIQWTNKNQL
eukprot:504865_1